MRFGAWSCRRAARTGDRMAPLARATRNFNKLSAAGADLADTAFKMGESAVAAGAVIGHRVALGAQALHDPLGTDPEESTRMSTEKLCAFAASSQAVLSECQSIQQEVVKFALTQTTGYFRAAWDMATSGSPDRALARN